MSELCQHVGCGGKFGEGGQKGPSSGQVDVAPRGTPSMGPPQHPSQGTAWGGRLGWGNSWGCPSMGTVPGAMLGGRNGRTRLCFKSQYCSSAKTSLTLVNTSRKYSLITCIADGLGSWCAPSPCPPATQGPFASPIPGEGRGCWLPLGGEQQAAPSLGHLPQARLSPSGGLLSGVPHQPPYLGSPGTSPTARGGSWYPQAGEKHPRAGWGGCCFNTPKTPKWR